MLHEAWQIFWRRPVRFNFRIPPTNLAPKILSRIALRFCWVRWRRPEKSGPPFESDGLDRAPAAVNCSRLIENAAQLSNVAVALHEQMLYVSTYRKFAEVSKEIAREKIELVRVIQLMAAGILQRGANVDLGISIRADGSLGEAVEKLRSATYTEIHDYSILVHIGKLSRSFKSRIWTCCEPTLKSLGTWRPAV